MPDENERYITQPTSVIDLQERQARDHGPAPTGGEVRSFQVEGNDTSAYIGVDPEYQNYADETHKPFTAEEGPEASVEKAALKHQAAPKSDVTTAPRHTATHQADQGSVASKRAKE